MLEARNVSLFYGATPALRDVSLQVEAGASMALMGASGSGKSSLLHCLAGVVVPDEGKVLVDGTDITRLSDRDRSRIRLERMGVVFQFGDLVPELTLVENVMLPLQLLKYRTGSARARAIDLPTAGRHRPVRHRALRAGRCWSRNTASRPPRSSCRSGRWHATRRRTPAA